MEDSFFKKIVFMASGHSEPFQAFCICSLISYSQELYDTDFFYQLLFMHYDIETGKFKSCPLSDRWEMALSVLELRFLRFHFMWHLGYY